MKAKRGFVTIATGSEYYYRLAANLLISYKKRGQGQYPFALICDRENEYTALFDDVVLVDDFRKSTLDKLLACQAPYDEIIFMDADMLILDNIDDLWDVFSGGDDVSALGCILPLDSRKGWFTYEGSGPYRDRVKYLLSLNGSFYYIRKGPQADQVFRDASGIIDNYSAGDYQYFDTPQDEPVMAMAMVINGCRPADVAYDLLLLPSVKSKVSVDAAGHLLVGGKPSRAKVIHFATANTRLFLYNYLNDRIQKEPEGPAMLDYWRMRLQYAPRDLKARLKHDGGAVLRKLGMDNVVDYLKRKRR